MANDKTNPDPNPEHDPGHASAPPHGDEELGAGAPAEIFDPAAFASGGAAGGSADSVAGLQEPPHGQFSGEEIEFESWMFDAGDSEGIVAPAAHDGEQIPGQEAQTEAPAPLHAAFEGTEVPAPSAEQDFVRDTDVPESPLDAVYTASERHSLDPELNSLFGEMLEGIDRDEVQVQPSAQGAQAEAEAPEAQPTAAKLEHEPAATPLPPEQYPATASEWTDQMLASVDDFSSVLLALRAPETQRPAGIAGEALPAPTLEQEGIQAPEVALEEPPVTPLAAAPEVSAQEPTAPGVEEASPAVEGEEPAWAHKEEDLPPWLQEQLVEEQVVREDAQPEAAAPADTGEYAGPVEVEAQEGQTQPAETEYAGPEPGSFEPAAEMPTLDMEEPKQAEEAEALSLAPVGSLPGVPEGGLKGDDLEFESFMFDEGTAPPLPTLPNIAQMMPVVTAMEGPLEAEQQERSPLAISGPEAESDIVAQLQASSQAQAESEASLVQMESVDEDRSDVPFWLQDRDPALRSGALPALTAADFPTGYASDQAGAADAGLAQPETAGAAALLDFSELPPIEPFDFSMIEEPEQEEGLGFRTDELAGMETKTGSMSITANLAAVDDLIGSDQSASLLDAYAAAAETGVMDSPSAAHPGSGSGNTLIRGANAPQASESHAQEQAARTPGWTATETTHLQAEAAAGRSSQTEESEAAYTESTDVLPETDLDVSPFDITELDLEFEDTITGMLTPAQPTLRPMLDDNAEIFLPGSLLTRPDLAPQQTPDYWETPEWMSDVVGEEGLSTRHLPAETAAPIEDHAPEETEEEQPPEDIFRARVSLFKYSDRDLLRSPLSGPLSERDLVGPQDTGAGADASEAEDAALPPVLDEPLVAMSDTPTQTWPEETWSAPAYEPAYEPTYEPAYEAAASPVKEPIADAGAETAASLVEEEAPVAPYEAVSSPEEAETPEPVSELYEFEALHQMVAARPQEIGPHMALAVAYAQAGHIEQALMEYRRILQTKQVSKPMLQMLSDQLDDLEQEGVGTARFHQVRGDLYMKLGRYEEAIDEYNKIK